MIQDRTPVYSVIQALYWMLFGSVIGFAPVFLLDQGLSASSIGVLVALANTAGAFLQPAVAALADRRRRLSLSRLISLFALGLALCGGLISWLPRGVMLAVFAGLITLAWILMPLVNAVGMVLNQAGMHCNYGVARAMGSLGFAALSFFMGWLIPAWGARWIPTVAAVLAALLGLMFLLVRMPAASLGSATDVPPADEGMLGFFRRYPGFWLVLGGVTLIFSFHNLTSTYLIQMIRQVGGGDADLANTLGLAALLELPAMIGFQYLARRLGSAGVMKLAAVFWVVKALAYLAAGQVWQIYGTQVFHGLAFAPFMPAIVYYSNEQMRSGDGIKGQAMMTTANTMGGILGNTMGGFLIDLAGVPLMLAAGAALTLTGAGALFAGLARTPERS